MIGGEGWGRLVVGTMVPVTSPDQILTENTSEGVTPAQQRRRQDADALWTRADAQCGLSLRQR